MTGVRDVVTINAPLHPETEGLFGDKLPAGRLIRDEYLIVGSGALAGTGAHSWSVTK
ncbi:hypothetical protein [Streptomyces sp. NPDC008137]|uniref:hypothetical protein n=1 Tax=Streptomyces sp. NPDC008137 TaxID=3364813 RepID=UPI0036EEC1CE